MATAKDETKQQGLNSAERAILQTAMEQYIAGCERKAKSAAQPQAIKDFYKAETITAHALLNKIVNHTIDLQ